MASRAASGKVLDALVPRLPALIGGSADLAGSNNTRAAGQKHLTRGDFSGSYIHFGVREHGMGTILNGMALAGLRPYGGTFLVFSDYMRPTIRLAAMMGLPVIYVFTHDSIGLGEDGPTHQPVEHLAGLRAIPNLHVFRPAEANETSIGWRLALERKDGPTALVLTRQGLPTLPAEDVRGAERGGYVLRDSPGRPDVILIATGSEVGVAMAGWETLKQEGVAARLVSLPCWELFEAQPVAYREGVLPAEVTARVTIEAGAQLGWERYAGPSGEIIGLERYGASAPAKTIFAMLGFTPEAVVTAAMAQIGRAGR
jgi:transketolase